MCEDRNVLKEERKKAKRLRLKIVGVGNTMDSYSEKYLKPPKTLKKKKTTPNRNRTYVQSERNFDKKTIDDKRRNMERSKQLQINQEQMTKDEEMQQKM